MGDHFFFYVNDFFIDPEVQTLWSYAMDIGHSQQDIRLWGVNQDPKDSKEPPLYAPRTQVLIKVWKDGSPKAQLQPTWKGPYPVIFSTPQQSKDQDTTPGFTTHESSHGKKTEEDTHYTCQQTTTCNASSTSLYKTTPNHGKYHSPLDGHQYKDSEA